MDNMDNLRSHEFTTGRGSVSSAKETADKKKTRIKLQVDETLKAIFDSDNGLLIEFINNAFGVSHDPKTSLVVNEKTEFIDAKTYEKIIADFIIKINEYSYYIEFQTLPDKTMLVRIFEYGFHSTLKKLKQDADLGLISDRLDIVWPAPLVIYIEEHRSIPETYRGSFKIQGSRNIPHFFEVPILKLWEMNLEDLINRKMYFLIPYLLMAYRHLLERKKTIEQAKPAYKEKYREIINIISQMKDNEDISYGVFQVLGYTSAHLADYLNDKYDGDEKFKEEVGIMLEHGEGLLAQSERRGIIKGKVELLVSDGYSDEQIAKKLNLSVAEVKKIKASLEVVQ